MMSKAALIALIEALPGENVQVFQSSIHYGGSDPEAHVIAEFGGIDQRAVFIKAA